MIKNDIDVSSNLIGELRFMKTLQIKPNFSDLSRKYSVDRHTIKKYYDADGIPMKSGRPKKSKWDCMFEDILYILDKPGVSYKAAYMYFLNTREEELPGDYNSFRNYCYRKHLKPKQKEHKPHVLYEVDPGRQLQADFKEDLSIHLKNGDLIEFNVFSATLAYSRQHIFIYSPAKTTDDFIRCTIEVFRRIGGVTETLLTDNMSAVVSCHGRKKKIHSRISQLFNDLDCSLKLCRARTPQTKGKDENANKFMNWLLPYDHEIESVDQLIRTIEETIMSQCNMEVNSGTNMPPALLFRKEKEYLKPLPNKVMLSSYMVEHYRKKVPESLLIVYKGSKYSVPARCLDQYVDIYPVEGNMIYIYRNKELVATHTISQNTVNYDENHYREALKMNLSHTDDIDEMAKKNLERLEKLGGNMNE